MPNLYYPAVFHPEETGYSVTVPDLEGCFTQGDTLDEAVDMTLEAIGLMIEDMPAPPRACNPAEIRTTGRDFVMAVPVRWKEPRPGREAPYQQAQQSPRP